MPAEEPLCRHRVSKLTSKRVVGILLGYIQTRNFVTIGIYIQVKFSGVFPNRILFGLLALCDLGHVDHHVQTKKINLILFTSQVLLLLKCLKNLRVFKSSNRRRTYFSCRKVLNRIQLSLGVCFLQYQRLHKLTAKLLS